MLSDLSRFNWLWLCRVAVLTAGMFSAGCSRNPDELLASGKKYIEERKFSEAVIELKNAVNAAPQLTEGHYQLGIALAGLGQLAEANQAFSKAVALDPAHTDAQLHFGNLLLLQRKFDEARAKAEQALSKDPSNVVAQILLGSTYVGVMHLNSSIQGLKLAFEVEPRLLPSYLDLSTAGNFKPQPELAEQAYRRALSNSPRSVEGHLALANLYLQAQQFPEAEEQYKNALGVEPESKDAMRALAFFFMQTQRFELAEQLYRRLSETDSGDLGHRIVLADFYAAADKLDQSLEVLQTTIDNNPRYVIAKKRLASLFLTRRRFDDAARLANEVLQQDSNDLEARLIKGRTFLAQNRAYDAIADLERVVKARPGFSLGRYYLGIAYAYAQDFRKAEGELLAAVQNDGTFLLAYIPLGELKLNAGLPDVAIRYARQALTDVSLSQAHLILARAYVNQKAFASAARELEEFFKKNPGTATGFYHLGLLNFAQGDLPQAEAALDNALKVSPEHYDSISLLATVYMRQNQPQKAIDRINQAISRFADNEALYRVLGETHYVQRDHSKAEQAFLKAVSLAPADTRQRLELAEFYVNTGVPQKSISTIQAVIADESGNLLARRQLVAVYLKQKDYGNALKVADDLVQLSPAEPDSLVLKGRILLEQGNRDEALSQFQDAVRKAPSSAVARYYLGMAHFEDGNLQAAETEWNEAVKAAGPYLAPYIALGQLKLDSGDREAAARYARQALLADPAMPEAYLVLALATRDAKDMKAAEGLLLDAVKRYPAEAIGHQRLGLLYMEQGAIDLANTQFEAALTIDPGSSDSMSGLVRIFLKRNRPQDAIQRVTQQIDRSPRQVAFWHLLGQIYLGQKNMAKAEESYRRAVEIAPDSAEATTTLSNFFVAAGQREKAIAFDELLLKRQPQNARVKRRLAGLYVAQRLFDQALPLVDELIKTDVNDVEARLLKGQLLLGQGKRSDAITVLQSAMNTAPSSAAVRVSLGRAYFEDSKLDQAEAAWNEALRIDNRSSQARLGLAQVKLRSGNPAQAILQASQALEIDPRLSDALLVLGNAQMMQKNLRGAVSTFEKLAAQKPGNPLALDRLGSAVAAYGDLAKAESYFADGLKNNPDNIDLLARLASNYLRQRQPEKAVQRIHEYISTHPNQAKPYELLGQVYLSQKDFKNAETSYRKALSFNSNNFEAYALLGQLFLAQNALDRAVTEFQNALKVDPKSVPAHILLGMIHEMKKSMEQAQLHYREALKLDPEAAVAANNLAWLLAESDTNLREAATLARVAMLKLPDVPNVLDTMGWIYYKTGAYHSAVDVLAKSLERDPKNATYHYHLGMSYYKLGNLDRAKTYLSGAIRLDPGFEDVDEAKRALASMSQ